MLEPLISVKLPPQKDYEADVSNIRPSRRVNARNVCFIILTDGNLTLVTGRSQPFYMDGFLMYITCPIDNQAPEALFTRGVLGHAPPENV